MAAEPALADIVAESDRLLTSEPVAVEGFRKDLTQWEQTYVQRPFPPNLGYEQGWANAEGNDDWKTIAAPGHWQRAGLNFSGVVWFRREVAIPDDWAGQDLTLSIGACDKSEWTYFNGEFMGSLTHEGCSNAWCTPRVYSVPGRLQYSTSACASAGPRVPRFTAIIGSVFASLHQRMNSSVPNVFGSNASHARSMRTGRCSFGPIPSSQL